MCFVQRCYCNQSGELPDKFCVRICYFHCPGIYGWTEKCKRWGRSQGQRWASPFAYHNSVVKLLWLSNLSVAFSPTNKASLLLLQVYLSTFSTSSRTESTLHYISRSHCKHGWVDFLCHHLLCDDDYSWIRQHCMYIHLYLYMCTKYVCAVSRSI